MVQKPKGREHQKSRRWYSKDVQLFSNKRDRQAVREKLKNEDYDSIPKDKPVKRDDDWGWD